MRTGDYYGWAAIPPEFIKRIWGNAGFDVIRWVPSGTLFPQAMVGLVKQELHPRATGPLRVLGRLLKH